MKRANSSLVLCLGLLSSGVAWSVPSAYSTRYGDLNIVNETNSTLLRDTSSSQIVWVLPPKSGKGTFDNFSKSANLGFCTGLKTLVQISNSLVTRQKVLIDQLPEYQARAERALQSKIEAQHRLAELEQAPGVKELILASDKVDSLLNQRMELLDRLESCVENCQQISSLYREASEDYLRERTILRELESQNRGARGKITVAKSELDSAEDVYMQQSNLFDERIERLAELDERIFAMFSQKGRLHGGYASITYDSGWEGNVQWLEQHYPAYDFRPIPTSNARLSAAIPITDHLSLPAILNYSVNGHAMQEMGTESIESESLPSRMVGDFALSLIGACPIFDPDFFDFITNDGMEGDQSLFFGMSSTFMYPAAARFAVAAEFNMWRVYELIKKTSKKAGFFSSSSKSSLVESDWGSETFTVDWLVEDPEDNLDFAERLRIQKELKEELVYRALNMMARPISNQNVGLPATEQPPQTGAIVLAKGLQKTCGANIYCQGTRWILLGANSIWGSSTSEASFRSSFDRTIREKWSSDTAKWRPGVLVYAK